MSIMSCLSESKVGDRITICYDEEVGGKPSHGNLTPFYREFLVVGKSDKYSDYKNMPILGSNSKDDGFHPSEGREEPGRIGMKYYWQVLPTWNYIVKIKKKK